MSDTVSAQGREFGGGPLSRGAALVYTLMMIEVLFTLTTLPGLVPLFLLNRDASNVPLYAICALPLGPATSAAVYAFARRSADLTDLKPASAFWRGYRMNLRGALRIWVPFLLLVTVIGVNLVNLDTAGVPAWWAVPLVGIGVVAALWCVNALVITSLFEFRSRDIARLAAYFLARTPGVTFGTAGLLVVAGAVTVLTSEAVLVLFSSVFVAMLVLVTRPMTTRIERDFTA